VLLAGPGQVTVQSGPGLLFYPRRNVCPKRLPGPHGIRGPCGRPILRLDTTLGEHPKAAMHDHPKFWVISPSLRKKHVTPHVLRHSMAMGLLQAGVDRAVIALWLGHESVETMQIYLEANLAMKEEILAKTTPLKRQARSLPAW
jgi:Phage integrase family